MRAFIQQYLDPADRLGEILFGLIMALGFTGAVRLGLEEPDNRALFIGIFGCNLAWAIVDGVMYVLTSLFERSRRARIAHHVRKAPTEEAAMKYVSEELDDTLESLTTSEGRQQIYRGVLEVVRRGQGERPSVRREDLLGGLAVCVVIVLATLPVIVPYLVVSHPGIAVRLSNLIALTLLFLLGMWWGRVVGTVPWRIGVGLTLIGMVLVGITIMLGG
jgi:VIT1/CCC1 family predicted Fe2+/Mn2+ transporter